MFGDSRALSRLPRPKSREPFRAVSRGAQRGGSVRRVRERRIYIAANVDADLNWLLAGSYRANVVVSPLRRCRVLSAVRCRREGRIANNLTRRRRAI